VLPGLLLAAILTGPARPADAQSPGDLRRANEQLRQENLELRAEVARLRAQLAEAEAAARALQDRIAELEEAGRTGAPPETGTPPKDGEGSADADGPAPVITVDETKPQASPRAVRMEARRRWEAGPGTLDVGVESTSPQRINYLRALVNWIRDQERTWRLDVAWTVRPVALVREDRNGTTWTMQAHDPVTDARLGDPFDVRARRVVVRQLERQIARAETEGQPIEPLRLTGTVVVRFSLDASRREPGTFDRPRLLAPFVAFEFGVEAQSIDVVATPPPAPAPAPAPAPGSTPGLTPGSPPETGEGGTGEGGTGEGGTGDGD
jgi:hypothetical protein